MTAIRRYVRAVAITWLLCQAASLTAFVPEQCCASHAAEAAAKDKAASESCHDAPPAEPKEGDACPMHHGKQPRSHECCAMTNACDGPGSHLARLLVFAGVPEPPQTSSVTLESAATFVSPQPPLLHRRSIPDAPPPKA
jgi:hypothetical protein